MFAHAFKTQSVAREPWRKPDASKRHRAKTDQSQRMCREKAAPSQKQDTKTNIHIPEGDHHKLIFMWCSVKNKKKNKKSA